MQAQSADTDQKPQRENLLGTLLHLLKFEPQEEQALLRYKPGDLGIVPSGKQDISTPQLPPINTTKQPSLTTLTHQQT